MSTHSSFPSLAMTLVQAIQRKKRFSILFLAIFSLLTEINKGKGLLSHNECGAKVKSRFIIYLR